MTWTKRPILAMRNKSSTGRKKGAKDRFQRIPRAHRRSGVTRPRASIASRMVLVMVLAGRKSSEFTMLA